jgi:hypothetical protein
MNDNKNQIVYCLTCNKLVDISQTTSVMKTGYYLVIFPLAANCAACADKPSIAPSLKDNTPSLR